MAAAQVGVRVKLASEGSGRWRDSAGEKSKFGLFITEILELLAALKARDMLDCLKLVHCHPGSQLQDIRRVKDAINELAHVYAELKLMGAGLEYIDVGGGLGVDYDGSGTNFPSSMNYTLNEYASDVVYRSAASATRAYPAPDDRQRVRPRHRRPPQRADLQCPRRLGARPVQRQRRRAGLQRRGGAAAAGARPARRLSHVDERRLVECYHDALTARDQALQMFNLGLLSLEFRGLAERLFWATCARIRDFCRQLEHAARGARGSRDDAVGHLFLQLLGLPVPARQLGDRSAVPDHADPPPGGAPDAQGVLADITCDSDGKIDRFVDPRDVKRTLELHELEPGEEYYLAAFLVGAYQETLGDLHNLFGDTHVVHIELHEEGGWWIEEIVKGDTANQVLEYMEYDVAELSPALARDCERAVREGRMTVAESQALKRFYENELNGYAYLEPADVPETDRQLPLLR